MEMGIKDKKITSPVIFFSMYIAIMLYQPEGLGTLTAFATISLTIIACVITGRVQARAFYMPRVSKLIFVFLALVTVVTLIKSGSVSSYYKFAAQIIFFIFLCSIEMSEREYGYIKWVFICTNMVYALLGIRYCLTTGVARYYHGDIEILGATFDPNYIGISLIAAMAMLLDNVLKGSKRVISTVMYFVIAVAVVLTASRGNMVSWVLSSVLVLVFFLKDRDRSNVKKILWIAVAAGLILFLIQYISVNYPEQWARMSYISKDSDNGRLYLWKETLELWKKSPLFGGGLRSMYYQYSRASHNTYLQILVDSGIVGSAIFLGFIAIMMRKAFLYNKTIFAVLCGMLLQIGFLDAIDNRVVWIVFCIIAMLPMGKESELAYEVISEESDTQNAS